jgi:hypothetical protein
LQERPGREFELGTLAAAGGVLYFHRSGAGVRLESLDDPLVPQEIAVLAPDPPLTCVDVAGTLLAGTSADGLALFSVADPTTPTLLGQLALDGDLQRCLLFDDLVVVLAEVAGQPGLVHVVDAGAPDSPQLIATFTVDPDEDGAAWRPSQLVGRGDQVLVLCRDPQTALPSTTRTMVIDLADPTAPTREFSAQDLDFWCYGPTEEHDREVVAAQRPARIGDRHVSFDGDQVTVFGYAGDPDTMTPQATWTAPGPVQRIAAVGNVLVVLSTHRLEVLTLSDSAPVAAPATTAGPAVRVAPNPFNPRTSFTFTMRAAGTVEVGIHDARGRRVRTLRASLPAGPASLVWEGTAQAGRALPSGTYLVEIRTPSGVQTTRCALIR